jgi:predicted porin
MKKKAAIGMAASTLLASGVVHAQSSVSLYGVIDTGIMYMNHAKGTDHLVSMKTSTQGNRWGLLGKEDLGGGLSAIFKLENGFNSGTGNLNQGGRLFGRGAYAGLSSNTLGTFTLGRQNDPLTDMVSGLTADAYYASSMGTPGDVDNYDLSGRVSNAVKYVSPTFAGLRFEGLYGLGNNAGATGQGQTWSLAVSYGNGPLSLAAGYLYATNPSAGRTAARTSNWGTTASLDNFFDGPINNGYTSASAVSMARAAARYFAGSFELGISYSGVQYKHDGFSLFQTTERYDVGSGYVNYHLNPAIQFGVGYSYERAKGDTSAIYHQIGIGADYAFSKRTDVYILGSYQHASGTQAVYNSAGQLTRQSAQASIGSLGFAGTSTQELVLVSLRHKF